MVGTIMLGLAGGLVASKLLHRRRFRHHHCADGRRGPFRRRWERPAGGARVPVDTGARLATLLATLELNQRQAEEAREAFADVAQALGARWAGWEGLEEALAAVAEEPFDRASAVAALGVVDEAAAKNALDALEHLHNILTPEQREKLSTEWR